MFDKDSRLVLVVDAQTASGASSRLRLDRVQCRSANLHLRGHHLEHLNLYSGNLLKKSLSTATYPFKPGSKNEYNAMYTKR